MKYYHTNHQLNILNYNLNISQRVSKSVFPRKSTTTSSSYQCSICQINSIIIVSDSTQMQYILVIIGIHLFIEYLPAYSHHSFSHNEITIIIHSYYLYFSLSYISSFIQIVQSLWWLTKETTRKQRYIWLYFIPLNGNDYYLQSLRR